MRQDDCRGEHDCAPGGTVLPVEKVRRRDLQVEIAGGRFVRAGPDERAGGGQHGLVLRLQGVNVIVEGMVLEPRTDRQVDDDWNVQFGEMGCRTDPRAHEDCRTAKGARRKDDFAS